MNATTCILLVDDNAATNLLNTRIIERSGVKAVIKVAKNGEEALTYFEGAIGDEPADCPFPDLVFLDINMPRMNGWEFLDIFRTYKFRLPQSTIIYLLTTSPNPDDVIKSQTYTEVTGFLEKPLTREMVREIVNRHFVKTV